VLGGGCRRRWHTQVPGKRGSGVNEHYDPIRPELAQRDRIGTLDSNPVQLGGMSFHSLAAGRANNNTRTTRPGQSNGTGWCALDL
jgi:hypothetical protein